MKKKELKKKMTELGRKGGSATAKKHGSAYMREIGLRGLAKRFNKPEIAKLCSK